MSTLTQFFGGGGDSFVGEYLPQYAQEKPFSFSNGDREYLRTGTLKTYSATYAPYAAAIPTNAHNTPVNVFTNGDWVFPNYGGHWNYAGGFDYPKMFTQGFDGTSGLPYKHIFYKGSHYSGYAYKMHVYGTNFAGNQVASAGEYWGSTYTIDKLNNRLLVCGYLPSADSGATGNYFGWVNTGANSPTMGTAYIAQADYQDTLYGAENIVAAQLWLHESYSNTNHTNGAYRTSDATTITKFTPNIDMRYPRKFTWSQTGNRFIIVRNTGQIVTIPAGSNTFTAISAGSITGANNGVMPTSVEGSSLQTVDHATNGTLMMLGAYTAGSSGVTEAGLYVLRTTNGTSFTIENLFTNNPQLAGFFSAQMYSGPLQAPRILLHGSTLIMFSQNTGGLNNFFFYSNDWGATWTQDYAIYNTTDVGNQAFRSFVSYDGVLYGLMCPRESYGDGTAKLYSFANRRFGATPQLIGQANGLAFAQNSSLSVYQRIK